MPPSIRDAESDDTRFGQGRFVLSAFVTEQDTLAQEFLAEHKSLTEYLSQLLSILPIPGL